MRPIRRYGLGRKTYISRPAQRWDSPRFRIPQRVVLHAESVAVPKIGMIRAVIHRPLVGVTKGATLKREADGHWYVALVVEQPAAPRTARPVQSHVGVDVGLKALAVYSTGETIANPHWYRTQTRKLRRAQQARKGSRSGAAWGFCAPETMAYGTRFHPKPPTSGSAWPILCALRGLRGSHVRLRVVLLNVRGLAKTKLAKSVVDAGWGLFRSMLEYKADRNDTYVVAIGRFFASSKTCGACGLVNADLTLADRVWTCPCGVQHDRDLNAARNIDDEGLRLFALRFAAGYAETQNACGDPVSPIVVDVG